MSIEEDIKRKGIMTEIIRRLTKLETDVRKLQTTNISLRDTTHPLAELGKITSGIEEDIKRKGIITEIIRRLTKLENDVRKLQTRG